jgi:hypothetical protein
MILPDEIRTVLRERHRDGVTPDQCLACPSSCCGHSGFAILENVLQIYDLYNAGKLRRRGHKFPKGLDLQLFVWAYFDVYRHPAGSEDDVGPAVIGSEAGRCG